MVLVEYLHFDGSIGHDVVVLKNFFPLKEKQHLKLFSHEDLTIKDR